jgi:predicted glycosyltransferase involved in capsule biosynthesis
MKKLSIVVPYRDREEHLKQFLPHMQESGVLNGIDYEILIVEQDDNPFNRGKLLNVGAVESPDSDYYAFHDVDMLPLESDYSFSEIPTHLASEAEQFGWRLPYEGYFGGVTMFDKENFFKINGYANEYWGWGCEDDDVLHRCHFLEVPCSRRKGRYQSLSHDRPIHQGLYNTNLQKYRDLLTSSSKEELLEKIKSDGISSLKYEKLFDNRLSEKVRHVKVKI